MELTEWNALYLLKAQEQEKAERKARARR